MAKINYFLDLGILGEDVNCVIEYDYAKEDPDTNCPDEISVTDVVIQGVVLSPENLSCLISDLGGDERLLGMIREKEASRYHGYMADKAEYLRDMER